jgi:hypothetical protein
MDYPIIYLSNISQAGKDMPTDKNTAGMTAAPVHGRDRQHGCGHRRPKGITLHGSRRHDPQKFIYY